jgi:hypothetical protein
MKEEPSEKIKDIAITLMKGATTVSKLFSKQISTTTYIKYKKIEEISEGNFNITGVHVLTDSPGDYAIVINVRGVETTYNSP